jgi:transcriptional regulator with XRE-family HTH domain
MTSCLSKDNLHEVAVKITVGQLRAARGLLGWSQEKLAEESGVGRATIADFEAGKRAPYDRTIEQLRHALEAAGVEFTNGGQPGVRIRKQETPETIDAMIAELREKLPPVDPGEPPSPNKAMRQLKHAHVKNEIKKLVSKRAKAKQKR